MNLKEKSAGGILSKNGKLMLVRVKNLMGKKVWTFPKGHIEKNETPKKAALREVWEETGWECKIIRPLFLARYRFKRNDKPVSKTVRWYLMEPFLKSGRPMAGEILSAQWLSPKIAGKRLKYKSDLRLLDLWKKL